MPNATRDRPSDSHRIVATCIRAAGDTRDCTPQSPSFSVSESPRTAERRTGHGDGYGDGHGSSLESSAHQELTRFIRDVLRTWIFTSSRVYSMIVEGTLAEALVWLEPRALLLAIALPPLIRLVGHLLPEEVFMVSIGVLAARAGSPREAVVLLLAVVLSHFVTDQSVYLGGRWVRPRLDRFPRVRDRLSVVTDRLVSSPAALLWFVPARVFPLARGAWLAGCGVVGVTWRRFVMIDLVALSVHLITWCGLGWWLAGDIAKLESTTHAGKFATTWAVVIIASITLTWFGWRHRRTWQPKTVGVARRLGRTLFPPTPSDKS